MTEINTAKLFSMKPHPYASVFPAATGHDYDNLLAGIRKLKKLRYSIVVYQNMILDGNQRIRACREARVEPRYVIFEGTDEAALDLVWDLNLGRRHLTASQRATAVARATLFYEAGRPNNAEPVPHLSTEEMAKKAGVTSRSVRHAKTVLRKGTEEEKAALESGEAKAKPLAEQIAKREQQSDNGVIVDESGYPVPKNALPWWNRRSEVEEILTDFRSVQRRINKLSGDDPFWRDVGVSTLQAGVKTMIHGITHSAMAYVCPYCSGINVNSCVPCRNTGLVSDHVWKHTIPESIKEKRGGAGS